MFTRPCKWCGGSIWIIRWLYVGYCTICTEDKYLRKQGMQYKRGERLNTTAIINRWLKDMGFKDRM